MRYFGMITGLPAASPTPLLQDEGEEKKTDLRMVFVLCAVAAVLLVGLAYYAARPALKARKGRGGA